ncbi:MAG: acetolactate synthase large subunit [Pseudomonadota bacterium]
MNGAASLVKTLLGGGLTTCFANPGTSEMHFVAALDEHPELRCILCLFEGGTSGAADGYNRMSDAVAATLLHLAPGFGNALANVHNALKANSGMLNVVGDHADYHLRFDSPLKGDVAGVTGTVSHWVRTADDARSVAADGAAALRAARTMNGQIATLILPANTAWEDADGPAEVSPPPALQRPSSEAIEAAAKALSQPGAALLLGSRAPYGETAELAGQIAAKTGCRLLADFLMRRMERGLDAVAMDRLRYVVDDNVGFLNGTTNLVLVGGTRPVSFFAYPGKPSTPEPADCALWELCGPGMDIRWTLEALADELGAGTAQAARVAGAVPEVPSGSMELEKIGQAIAALMPENAIIVDESVTVGRAIAPAFSSAPRHDLLSTTGGAIGQGLPVATGAAVACPDRKVIALTGDGSAMYTVQSLWTMAREELDVTVIVFANRGYQILRGELANVGVETVGRNAVRMLDVDDPLLDWVALARGHGVPAMRVEDTDGFVAALRRSLGVSGPALIEVVC